MISTISQIDSGSYIIFRVNDKEYYRLTRYSSPRAKWFKFTQEALTPIVDNESLLNLDTIFENYMEFTSSTRKEITTDEVFIKIGDAIRKKENFNSSVFQPNSHGGPLYKIVVKEENKSIFFFVGVRPRGNKFDKRQNFLLATFKSDGTILLNIPPKNFSTNKFRKRILKRFFVLLNRLYGVPKCFYGESKKEKIAPILYTFKPVTNFKYERLLETPCPILIDTNNIDSFISTFNYKHS
jgi:hypothetical protein